MSSAFSSSGVVEEPAAVYAARLAQLAARRAKKGAKTVSSAPMAGKSAEPRRPKPFTGEGGRPGSRCVIHASWVVLQLDPHVNIRSPGVAPLGVMRRIFV